MKLIAITVPKIVTSKAGNVRKRKQGIFECPVCLLHVIQDYSNGIKGETCSRQCRLHNGCTTHGMSNTPLYVCWNNMRLRCDKIKHKSYKYYGAKGISYPEKWNTFEGFFADMGISYKEGLTIDRKNKLLNYSIDNCQWLPMEINRIKDRIKAVMQSTFSGELLATFVSTAEAARKTGFSSNGISRAARGERRHYRKFIWEYV